MDITTSSFNLRVGINGTDAVLSSLEIKYIPIYDTDGEYGYIVMDQSFSLTTT
jgi:hypothetical protein